MKYNDPEMEKRIERYKRERRERLAHPVETKQEVQPQQPQQVEFYIRPDYSGQGFALLVILGPWVILWAVFRLLGWI